MKEFRTLRSLLYSSSVFVISYNMFPIAFNRYPKAIQDRIIQNEVKTSSTTELGVVPTFFIVVKAQYYAYK